jgi:hypothetical protein
MTNLDIVSLRTGVTFSKLPGKVSKQNKIEIKFIDNHIIWK